LCASVAWFKNNIRAFSRKTLVIDCRELLKGSSETQMIAELARQTGYRPVFTMLNSMNNLIDLASVGLIGQKGWSTFVAVGR
jgi:hypothetical protein